MRKYFDAKNLAATMKNAHQPNEYVERLNNIIKSQEILKYLKTIGLQSEIYVKWQP